jgi:phenylalanine-4-hydroxylase
MVIEVLHNTREIFENLDRQRFKFMQGISQMGLCIMKFLGIEEVNSVLESQEGFSQTVIEAFI